MSSTPEAAEVVIERDVRLSESLLWRMQEEYYGSRGVEAWNEVPSFVTNNAFVADAYAEMIVAWLLDYLPHLDRDEPVWVAELGGGTGCFSFLLLQALVRKLQKRPRLAGVALCYLITDVVEANVAFCERNPSLAPYRAAGVLETAVWRPEREAELRLRGCGQRLAPGMLANPLLVIANYVFDSIAQDLFRVAGGALEEARWTFFQAGVGAASLDQLGWRYEFEPVPLAYYPDPALNEVLGHYATCLDGARFLIPVGALACIRNMLALSSGNLVLIASDKGYTETEDISWYQDPRYQCHGSISWMVNFDAIQRYMAALGGGALFTVGRNLSLVTSMSWLLRQPADLEHCAYYFAETLQTRNPINYLHYLQRVPLGALDADQNDTWRAFTALVRLSCYDPVVFSRVALCLETEAREGSTTRQLELLELLEQVRANCYAIEAHWEASFWLGRVFAALRRYEPAGLCYLRCVELRPWQPSSYYNLGTMLEKLGRYAEAADALRGYIALAPDAEDADAVRAQAELLDRLEDLPAGEDEATTS